MCGIAGVLLKNNSIEFAEAVQWVENIQKTLLNRGPDDCGSVLFSTKFEGCVLQNMRTTAQKNDTIPYLNYSHSSNHNSFPLLLSHNRLSIISPGQLGHQPMSCSSGVNWLVYNGEIYNYKIVEKQWQYQNISNTDSELLLNELKSNGAKRLHELDGFFAFCYFNTEQKKLILARDLTGVKPLYYVNNSKYFAFASQPDVLFPFLQNDNYNKHEIFNLLAAGVQFPNRVSTYFDEIFQVAPGEILEFELNELIEKTGKLYGKNNLLEKFEIATPISQEQLNLLVANTIESRLMADVPVGFAVSGGLDSSAIVGISRNFLGENATMHGFSIISKNHNTDESQYQKEVAIFNSIQWHAQEVKVLSESELIEFCSQTNLPAVAWNNIAHFQLMKTVKFQQVKVILNGQGADELFGGYPEYLIRDYKKITGDWDLFPFSKGACRSAYIKMAAKNVFSKLYVQYLKKYTLLNAGFLNELDSEKLICLLPGNESATVKMRMDFLGAKLGQMLLWDDANSMAHSVEGRNPFADSMPLAKATMAFDFLQHCNGNSLKSKLRLAARDSIASKVLHRVDKKGFTVPDYNLNNQVLQSWKSLFFDRILDDLISQSSRSDLYKKLHSKTNYTEKNYNLFFRICSISAYLLSNKSKKSR